MLINKSLCKVMQIQKSTIPTHRDYKSHISGQFVTTFHLLLR